MEQHAQIFEQEGFDEVSKAYLLETVRWTKFIAIVGFIFIGLAIIGGISVIALGSAFSSYSSDFPGVGMGIIVGLAYLVAAFLYLYPVIALLKFSSCIKKGLNTGSQELITAGFRHQRNMYKFMGIMLILTIILYLVIILFAGAAGIMSRA